MTNCVVWVLLRFAIAMYGKDGWSKVGVEYFTGRMAMLWMTCPRAYRIVPNGDGDRTLPVE